METIGIIESSVWRFRFRVSLGCFFQGARGAGTRILRGGGGGFGRLWVMEDGMSLY